MRPKKYKHVPCDLLPNILSRLPQKSLKRFECVSKSWYNLIKDPDFAIQHHRHSESINQNCLLVQVGTRHVSMLCFDDITEDVSVHWINLPNSFDQSFKILGPCNGIYCFHNKSSVPNFIAVLGNVALREFNDVPHLSITPFFGFPFPQMQVCGFGFDPKTNDYKIVIIVRYSGQLPPYFVYRLRVYSLRCNSWRNLDSTLFKDRMWRSSSMNTSIYVNGNCHWLVSYRFNDDRYVILSFNMADEVFQLIRFPKLLDFLPYGDTIVQIALYIDSLSVVVLHEPEKTCDVWIMQDYSNDESWTKLVTIGPIAGVTWPLGFWRNGKFLFQNYEGRREMLSSYDLSTEKIKNLHVCGSWGAYSDSLVSIRGDQQRHDQNMVKEDGSTHETKKRRWFHT